MERCNTNAFCVVSAPVERVRMGARESRCTAPLSNAARQISAKRATGESLKTRKYLPANPRAAKAQMALYSMRVTLSQHIATLERAYASLAPATLSSGPQSPSAPTLHRLHPCVPLRDAAGCQAACGTCSACLMAKGAQARAIALIVTGCCEGTGATQML